MPRLTVRNDPEPEFRRWLPKTHVHEWRVDRTGGYVDGIEDLAPGSKVSGILLGNQSYWPAEITLPLVENPHNPVILEDVDFEYLVPIAKDKYKDPLRCSFKELVLLQHKTYNICVFFSASNVRKQVPNALIHKLSRGRVFWVGNVLIIAVSRKAPFAVRRFEGEHVTRVAEEVCESLRQRMQYAPGRRNVQHQFQPTGFRYIYKNFDQWKDNYDSDNTSEPSDTEPEAE